MAKRIIDWTTSGTVLNLNKYNPDKTAPVETLQTFDLEMIFSEFETMDKVAQHIVVYGAKQLLADSGANAIGDVQGKVDAATEKWALWLKGELNAPRANATGNATLKSIKEASKVISLEGLMAKKLISPNDFTEEDQEKLDEFLVMAAKAKTKTKK